MNQAQEVGRIEAKSQAFTGSSRIEEINFVMDTFEISQ
jgi:hypothetical protein